MTLEVAVRPPGLYRLPRSGSMDGVMRCSGGVVTRFLRVEGRPVLVRAWQPATGEVRFRAEAIPPSCVSAPELSGVRPLEAATRADLELAIERMRFAVGVDDDLAPFVEAFGQDPLLGPLIRRRPWVRPGRRPWAWEAFAWAVTQQLIESSRAATIQRRIVGRWGPKARVGRDVLRDVPCAAAIAGRAPAELESMDLSARRSVALRLGAVEISRGRCDPGDPVADVQLTRISSIGPWTVQCVGLFGRGDQDSLPAGDLAYIKLVGHLAGLGRRATVAEVEEFYAPYAPFRGLAGVFTLNGLHHIVGSGPPLAPAPVVPQAA